MGTFCQVIRILSSHFASDANQLIGPHAAVIRIRTDCGFTIEAQLKKLQAPTLIVWGTDDIYFDVKWSYWLAKTTPGARRRTQFDGARLFFSEERWQAFNTELREHWTQGAGWLSNTIARCAQEWVCRSAGLGDLPATAAMEDWPAVDEIYIAYGLSSWILRNSATHSTSKTL